MPFSLQDVLPAIELMSSPDRLQTAVTKPAVFLKELLAAVGPVGKKVAMAKLRPELEPELAKLRPPLTWSDVSPVVDLISSVEQLLEAVEKPGAFIVKLISEQDAKLAQKLGQLQPFLAVFPQECMGQLASFGPT
jgi:hypothetical protein